MFGPISDTTDGLIRKVQIDYYADTNRETAKRELRYTATPKALKDYNNDNVSVLREPLNKTETRISVSTSAGISVGDRIIIDSEIMKIVQIVDGTTITVKRGYDGSSITTHVENTSIDKLTAADDSLIDVDDDFGFNENIFSFSDSRDFSPSRSIDI